MSDMWDLKLIESWLARIKAAKNLQELYPETHPASTSDKGRYRCWGCKGMNTAHYKFPDILGGNVHVICQDCGVEVIHSAEQAKEWDTLDETTLRGGENDAD